eukprot:5881241-Pyramimonas_sp.AAC.2
MCVCVHLRAVGARTIISSAIRLSSALSSNRLLPAVFCSRANPQVSVRLVWYLPRTIKRQLSNPARLAVTKGALTVLEDCRCEVRSVQKVTRVPVSEANARRH